MLGNKDIHFKRIRQQRHRLKEKVDKDSFGENKYWKQNKIILGNREQSYLIKGNKGMGSSPLLNAEL